MTWWYEVRKNEEGYYLVETDADNATTVLNGMYFETLDGLKEDVLAMLDAIKAFEEQK